MNTIYTIGYSGWRPVDLKLCVDALGAMLLDIRYSPRSKRPEWTREALRGLWGIEAPRYYTHIQALGNRNYANGGPIELAAPLSGLRAVRPIWQRQPIVLLCACRHAGTCHRAVAAEYLAAELEAPVVDLYPDVVRVCQDQACGATFVSTDPDRRYCNRCIAERINGAGILEDDDDDPDPIAPVVPPAPAPAPPAVPTVPTTALIWSPSIKTLAKLGLTPALFRVACQQWQVGCPVFGFWASQHVRPWGVTPYGELIALVRQALGDTTDYSKEGADL